MRFVWDRVARDWMPAAERAMRARVGVIPDVEPYRSIVTGELIGGRRQHREHLRAHDLVEVGNERRPPSPAWRPSHGSVAASLKRARQERGG